jgi:hypothetical protein
MRKVLQMIGSGGMPKLPKGMKAPPNMPMPQGMRQAQGGFPGGKKRKKGGPWGLIKSR